MSISTPDTTRGDVAEFVGAGHKVIPVTRELFADAETPVSMYRKLAIGEPGSFLLESAEQGGIWSRFSFVGVSSYGVLTDIDGAAAWQDYGISAERAFGGEQPQGGLDALAALYARWKTPRVENLPPLTGGLVGFIGWEAVRQLENLPNAPVKDIDVPGQGLSFAREVIVLDHKYGTVTLIANVLADGEISADELFAEATSRLDALQARLAAPGPVGLATVDHQAHLEASHRSSREEFLLAVVESRKHIVDGDVFQVVLSQRFDVDSAADPVDVYRVLRSLNPSPYMYLLALETVDGRPYSIVGSSPEALVKVQQGRVITHPIAGSRPRGATPEQDAEYASDLLADEKERSEHLMLVDLARNDLLRVCSAGSVEVTEFMRIERYSHIMHIVSSVEGDLSEDKTSVDVFRATFPAGTLSGAPKPRALEIIDALEPAQRGVYGGVVGYFGFSGDADLAIAIRTATLIDGKAHVQAGAGLVLDSVPETEFIETENKAAAPLRAVAIANSLRSIS
jgi:anthranilate synthase component 1